MPRVAPLDADPLPSDLILYSEHFHACAILPRMGYRTLLVDRTKFPSDIISTHLIWQTGTAHLKRWGTSRTRRGFQLPVDFQGHLRFRRLCPEGLGAGRERGD